MSRVEERNEPKTNLCGRILQCFRDRRGVFYLVIAILIAAATWWFRGKNASASVIGGSAVPLLETGYHVGGLGFD